MSNYSDVIGLINAQIKTNGLKAITGAKLNGVLLEMVEELGAGYQYKGVATPATDPGTPDENVFYIATEPGNYTNFGGLAVSDGEVAILKGTGSTWTKEVTGAATAAQVSQLGQQLGKGLADSVIKGYYYDTSGTKQAAANYRCIDPILVNTDNVYIALYGGKFLTVRCFDESNVHLGSATRLSPTNAGGVPKESYYQLQSGTKKICCYWQIGTEDYTQDYIIYDVSAFAIKQDALSAKTKASVSRINLFNPDDPNIVDGYLESNGAVTYMNSYITSWLIPVSAETTYYGAKDYTGNDFQRVLQYNSSYEVISGTYESNKKQFTTAPTAAYVRLTYSKSNVLKQLSVLQSKYVPYSNDVSKDIFDLLGDIDTLIENSKKVSQITEDYFMVSSNFIDNSYYQNGSGVPASADTYARTGLIKADKDSYIIGGFKCGGVYCFSANAPTQTNFLGMGIMKNEQIILYPGTAYFGINFQKALQPDGYYEKGFICNFDKFFKNQTNILYGKKWAVVGDSFSEWTNAQFSDGPYKNKYKTYKFLIALRNNMVIQDLTLSGRTMAYPSDHTFDNAFAKPELYQSIAADADYITIMLGINDVAHLSGFSPDQEPTTGAITIGTIDSSDTGTFYGAWNVVLQWIFEHNPNAHIGIIITNGLAGNGPEGVYSQYGEAIYEALQNIVKRWNIPYIDLNGGDGKTPMMHRGIYPQGTPASLIAAKWNAFATTPTGSELNGHTNAAGHEYESTFIENFLRSI